MRYCGRLREMIFFLSTATRATGDVRGVFGGPQGTALPGGLGTSDPNIAKVANNSINRFSVTTDVGEVHFFCSILHRTT